MNKEYQAQDSSGEWHDVNARQLRLYQSEGGAIPLRTTQLPTPQRPTTGEVIRGLLEYFPGTYELNLAVACSRRWGWGRNWAGSAETLLAMLHDDSQRETVLGWLRNAGIETKGN